MLQCKSRKFGRLVWLLRNFSGSKLIAITTPVHWTARPGLLVTTEAMAAEVPKKKTAPAMPGGGIGGMDY